MADKKPFLQVVPYENGSYYRLRGNKLIVLVKNTGDAPAKATTTRVDFAGHGSYRDPQTRDPQDHWTQPLNPGDKVELEFDRPCDDCFDPDCEFNITVDVKSVLGEGLTRVTCGVARGPKLSDLLLVPDEKGQYGSREGTALKFKVQNQGADYARSSTAKVKFGKSGEYREAISETKELEPGEETVLSFQIPDELYKSGLEFTYTIILDIDNVVKELSKDNNVANGSCTRI